MDDKLRLLLAEDDKNLGMLLREYLNAKSYDVTLCTDGEEAIETYQEGEFDFCILDVMMPKKDGFTVAKEIRSSNIEIPIIFLTAKGQKEDVVEGLSIGGDDYITKPFNIEELIARIETIRRRVYNNNTNIEKKTFTLGSLTFDSNKQVLISEDGHEDKLTTKECELLYLLCINANKVLEREIALKTIWNDDHFLNVRTMDVYITKLRKHLKKENSIEIINVHGKGYKLIV
ncbi:MAG: response regulator transcription factor [Marinifilaceae bacterium]|jgi:DNA-binding response OmpR family regulator|nr:response regulator transcription factor [Marinilabiliaceae bacterium JC040]MCT4600508.1 response regulator transcription factor [Marinifilaceae bacterium]